MRDIVVPASLVHDCVEVHLARHAPSGRALYLTTLALAITAAASLGVIEVPVTVQANGTVRPIVERQDARAAESGIVRSVAARDGALVDAGDTLLTLDETSIAARLAASDSIARVQTADLADLATILQANDVAALAVADIRGAHRRQQLREYASIEAELIARAAVERRERERLQQLHTRGFATPEQVERQDALHRAADAAVREHRERARTQWSESHARLADELRRRDAERAGLVETLAHYAVLAPIGGTIELSTSLSPGSVLQRGERIASISPNTELIGEALLSPRDIGLVQLGMPARLMVDAFNYRDWGVVNAVVSEVSDDAIIAGDAPLFRVRCRLSRTALELPGGHRASLRKGMTFRARFVVANRSLLQLMFDDVDDWLNPARSSAADVASR